MLLETLLPTPAKTSFDLTSLKVNNKFDDNNSSDKKVHIRCYKYSCMQVK